MVEIKKAVACLIIIPFLAMSSGCASYRFGRLPSPYVIDHPNAISQNDVTIAVKFYNDTESLATFDCEMGKREITPVFITIENKSSNTYGFRKADVDTSYLECEEAFKKCARSTMGRCATYGILGVFVITAIIFIPMMIGEMINSPRINAQMRSDYCTNQIADSTIGPGRSLSGVMYVAPFQSGSPFTIPLVDRESGEKLLFQFQYNQPASISKKPETKKEPEKKESSPKQNFGPK